MAFGAHGSLGYYDGVHSQRYILDPVALILCPLQTVQGLVHNYSGLLGLYIT